MSELKVETWPIERLVPYCRNPRRNDEQVDRMMSAIKEFGFRIPIVAKSDGAVVDGHLRLKAAQKLGLTEVPVALADELTDAQVKAFRLLANKSANWAAWDDDLLKLELTELQDMAYDLDMTGFEAAEIDTLLEAQEGTTEGLTEEDDVPEAPKEPITREGDIWLLGKHRLMCGDSTDAGTVALLMNGEKADMVFTDPPYGMGKEKEGVLNDNQNAEDLLDFNRHWILPSFDMLKDNGSWYCWGTDEPLMDIYAEILKPIQKQNRVTFRNLLTWDKGDAGAGGVSFMGHDGLRSYPVGSEKCLFVMCGVQGFNSNKDNYFDGWEPIREYLVGEAEKVGLTPQKLKEICGVGMFAHWFSKSQFAFITEEHYKKLQEYYKADAFKKEYDELKKEYDELKKEYYSTRAYFDNTHDKMTDVWPFGRVKNEERAQTGGHATPKPIVLCERAIKTSSRKGESVLDLFGGSGSTLIACEKTGRICRMMELSPHYCDVIVKRWQDFTGQEAILESDGKTYGETEKCRK